MAATRRSSQTDETNEDRAEGIVRKRYPDATSITYLESRKFLDGHLIALSYRFTVEDGDDDDDEDELIYIYFDEVDKSFPPRVCELQDELASLVNDLQFRSSNKFSHKLLDYIFQQGGTAVLIALALVGVLAVESVGNYKIDDKLWNIFLLVVGFYFGTNVPPPKSTH